MNTLSYDATGAARKALEQHLSALVEDRVATRIFAKDHTLWGPDAESESAIRLGWVEAATVSRALVDGILELRDALQAEGVTRIVLCGMGGSSLAPEVITGTAGVELTVLDSTDPERSRGCRCSPPVGPVLEVRFNPGNRFAAPDLRAGLHRRRHRRPEPDHRRDRSRFPAGQGIA